MCEALDKYQPDFVVFLGDNTTVSGYEKQVAAIDALTKPTRARGIPCEVGYGGRACFGDAFVWLAAALAD